MDQSEVHLSEVERHGEAEVPRSAKLAVRTEACVAILVRITVGAGIKLDSSNVGLLSRADLGRGRGVEGEPRVISNHRQLLHFHLVLEGGMNIQLQLRLFALKVNISIISLFMVRNQ